jgi:concanavalin A-like lectin/glucanase superfamily protein
MLKRSILVALCVLVLGPAFSALAGLDSTLVGWWAFDEGTGTVAIDGSGNGNDGVLSGDPLWTTGPLDGALDFRGTSSFVTAPHIPLDDRSFTIAMWVNLAANNAEHIAFSQGPNATNTGLHLRLGGTGNPAAGGINFGFYSSDLVTDGGILELDTWYHLGFVYDIDDQQKRIYVDGELVAEGASAPFGGTTQDTIIGSWNNQQYLNGMLDDVQVYHRVLAEAEVAKIMNGLTDQSIAQNPSPESEATDVPRDVVLTWDAGEFAATHDVYFGTSLDDVDADAGTLISQGETAATYAFDNVLEFGQTYYWRIDEVNAAPDNTIFTGEIWSFTVEPFAYAVENVIATTNGASDVGVGIENTINGSGLNADDQHSSAAGDMWLATPGADPLQLQYELDGVYKLDEMLVWNYNVQFEPMLGFGLKDVTVEYSENGTDWMVLGDVELAQATARSDYAANTAIDFGGAAVKSVRLTVNSGYGPLGQFGLSEVRFMYVPASAREPQPVVGDTNVAAGTTLSWRGGREAVTHDVYLSTDPNALALIDSVSETSSTPGNLEFGSTYYWRIDEVNEADDISVWPGMVWDFMTEEFAVIDDMESYNDEDNVIYEAWIDGWVNETGSTVGYFQAPFAEKTVVNGGLQSMPLAYDNSVSPFYSEVEKDLGGANWNSNAADSLRLFVSGLAPAFAENADGTVLMNAIGADIWGTGDQFRYAYKSLTGDGSMIARVDSLDNSMSGWAKAGVMIRQGTGTGSQHSMMCMTGGDGNGASWQGRVSAGLDSVNSDATAPVALPYWVKIERAGNSLTGSVSADGETWTQLGDPREVQMDDPVLIGLALTSHLATQATSAQFSNVSFTGSVSGAWQTAEIGVAQPEGNAPDSIYVALEDSTGKVTVVTHPDPVLSARSGWTEWVIPYTDLTGINLGNVKTMYIGVGDRNNPTSGGDGLVLIDDVGYGRPFLAP